MVKKTILIYDARSGKLTQVCDVRDLELAKFDNFKKEAKENIKAIIKEQDEREAEKEKKYNETIDDIQKRIMQLNLAIRYLLGWKEISDEDLKALLHAEEEPIEEEPINEQSESE